MNNFCKTFSKARLDVIVKSMLRQKSPHIPFISLGIILLCLSFFSYRSLVDRLQESHYQIFDFTNTVSWIENKNGIYRTEVKGTLDNTLLSNDPWKDYEISFNLANPGKCLFVFDYQDHAHFSFLYLHHSQNIHSWGANKDGTFEIPKSFPFQFKNIQKVRFKIDGRQAQLHIDDQLVSSFDVKRQNGRMGFIMNDVGDPLMIVHDCTIEGTLEDGRRITGRSPTTVISSVKNYAVSFILFVLMLALLTIYFAALLQRAAQGTPGPALSSDPPFPQWLVVLYHFLLAAGLFWPFLSRGEVLISSYDNLGEIIPLFFFSKHNFLQLLNGESLSLWNPYSFNGMPFYTNHWNMIYDPLNWPIFLAPDRHVLPLLTLRTLIEVFLIGVLAYGFFSIELPSKKWALFCSTIYQLCSVVLFTFTIFPTISLYFGMTLYLYLLWSMSARRPALNYLFLTGSLVLMLISANVAFVFYAMLMLSGITLFRLLNLADRRAAFGLVGAGFLTAFLISAVRLLPCLWGILESNRLVDNYYTLHDRIFLIVRFVLPEITGWLGSGTLPVFESENLNLIFKNAFPTNSQNAFLAYFGIIPAALLLISLFVKMRKGPCTFWKFYAWGSIAIALLWQPLWGILSVLFFPLFHYSYHIIILPVSVCALIGHTGCLLERPKTITTAGKKTVLGLLFLQGYALVFITYLFPNVTPWSRLLICIIFAGGAVFWVLRRDRPQWLSAYIRAILAGWNGLLWTALFTVFALLMIKPLPGKAVWGESIIIPFLSLAGVMVSALYLHWLRGPSPHYSWKKSLLFIVPFAGIAAGGSLWVLSKFLGPLLSLGIESRNYFIDNVLGHVKFHFLLQLAALGFLLSQLKRIPRRYFLHLIILITAFDLLVFNNRFENIAAPFFHNKAFYANPFPYADIRGPARASMDLVNYRVNFLNKGGVNGNIHLIFDIPTYTGILGYMPKEYSLLLHYFGYPLDTILLYPGDGTNDERFLDLSSVKYAFINEDTVETRPAALARLNVFHNYQVIADDKQTLETLRAESFKPREVLLLSEPPALPVPQRPGRPSRPIPIAAMTREKIEAQISADAPALVLFNESYHHGWRAYLDGQPLPILRANYHFMACVAAAGNHTISFRFEPKDYVAARNVSGAGLMLLLIGTGILTAGRRIKKAVVS